MHAREQLNHIADGDFVWCGACDGSDRSCHLCDGEGIVHCEDDHGSVGMTLPLYFEDGSRGVRAPRRLRGDRVLSASPTEPLRVSSLRVTPDWRGVLLDDGTDTFNRVCTHIAIIMLGGLLAIYLETL